MIDKTITAQGVEIRLVRTDQALIESIALKRGLPVPAVKEMLRYNVFTINQFRSLTGSSISTITSRTRPSVRHGKICFDLDVVYPFQDSEGVGPKFILRNEKSEAFLI